MTILIALVGQKRSGKDTFADIFMDNVFGYFPSFTEADVFRYALANPIKRGLCELLSLDTELFYADDLKEYPIPTIGFTPRHLMQWLGTDIFHEKFGSTVWLDVFERELDKLQPEIAIVTDIRFQEELDYFAKRGAYIVSIKRDSGFADTHLSEKGLSTEDLTNYVIHNNGSLDGYKIHCAQVVNHLCKDIRTDIRKDVEPQSWGDKMTVWDAEFFRSPRI